MDPIKILEELEPIFIKAGELAYSMQKGVKSYNKCNTGNQVTDIVTTADFAVQEFLLKAMSETELVNCHLLAEEDTPLVKQFKNQNNYYLAIDPIDDTAIYATGGKHFSTIISLHDGNHMLYMFIYFPAWNWTHKIVNNQYSVFGETPQFTLLGDAKNTIIYWSGDLKKTNPKLFEKLTQEGLIFRKVSELSEDIRGIAMFSLGKVAGIYHENMNVYDGLAEFAIARARGLQIYSEDINGAIDLKNIAKRESGFYYPSYYVALNRADDSSPL